MTSREAFESTILNSRSIWIFDEKSNSYPQSGHVQATWVVWQAAIEWASKQAIDAVDKVIPEEAPEYQFCQEAIKESLS